MGKKCPEYLGKQKENLGKFKGGRDSCCLSYEIQQDQKDF